MRWSFASILGAAALAFALPTLAGDVKEADATCHTATAILLTGDGNSEDAHWSKIREVVSANKKLTVVREAPTNRVGEVALTRFDIKHTFKGGPTVAYTVQCGHGGTCNDVAKEFHTKFPTLTPVPVVQCGDVSNVLTNPQPAP
ncbi:MAG: hypothetical protein HOV80_04390 [Polyangiaceae bacterium]|nr:hypothetical protein [Polyangiaceae bacterium]